MNKFNKIKSRNNLASFLEIPEKKLNYLLYVKKVDSYYTKFDIPKKSGGCRHISAPVGELKVLQKKLAKKLYIIQSNYKIELSKKNHVLPNISQAFEKGKNILTNAKIHRNKRIIIHIDIENFFDSFHFGRVRGFFLKNQYFKVPENIATIIAQLTCYEGKLPQGAPTSPIITNLICNILDMRLLNIARKFHFDYTRYADDMTFSTNDKKNLDRQEFFLKELRKEINGFGLSLNESKTRIDLKNYRQCVTGLVVNKKINIKREYYRNTRAMADALYHKGEFLIDGTVGTLNQLEGRFSFINQVDHYNNKIDGKTHKFPRFNAHEKQYQKFLFYKYFIANTKPLIITEGKTDIRYLKSALKSMYKQYPNLISRDKHNFVFHISFLRKTNRLMYFWNINTDGASAMQNLCEAYRKHFSIYNEECRKNVINSRKPIILLFDNEQINKNKPLKMFKNKFNITYDFTDKKYYNIIEKLYILTVPLIDSKNEAEIEDLFDSKILSCKIKGKVLSRADKVNRTVNCDKNEFSQYIMENYKKIDFTGFKETLSEIDEIINTI